MILLDSEAVETRLPYELLVPVLRDSLAQYWQVPQRVPFDLGGNAQLLVMPA